MSKLTLGPCVLPAIACPGHAPDSVTIPLGYGQKVESVVGKDRGFDANGLRANGAASELNQVVLKVIL